MVDGRSPLRPACGTARDMSLMVDGRYEIRPKCRGWNGRVILTEGSGMVAGFFDILNRV